MDVHLMNDVNVKRVRKGWKEEKMGKGWYMLVDQLCIVYLLHGWRITTLYIWCLSLMIKIWRKMESAGVWKPQFRLRDYYTDMLVSIDSVLRYSQDLLGAIIRSHNVSLLKRARHILLRRRRLLEISFGFKCYLILFRLSRIATWDWNFCSSQEHRLR